MNVQRYARIAGVLFLVSLVAGGFGEAYIPSKPMVAVDATTFGLTVWPSSVQEASRSIADSYRPTMVPSGPEMRCSSSWMIRSGGRSRGTGRTVAAGSLPSALCWVVISQPP